MKNWFTRLFNPEKTAETTAPNAADWLAMQNELQSLRMELESNKGTIANLKQEIERQRERQQQLVEETVNARMEKLFSDLAAPASQILTQANLLETQGKPVQARDVLVVARRMVRAMERHGLLFEGQIGQQAAFDPNHHIPMNAGDSPQVGQPVTIHFMGVLYQGKMIYKAVVE